MPMSSTAQSFSMSAEMSYPLIFMIGLVASVSSCMAVTGGLLVAIAAKYNETHGTLSTAERLKPLIYFNTGRVISYTLLGGAIGALGSALTLSPDEEKAHQYAMLNSDEKGPCCCQCWR